MKLHNILRFLTISWIIVGLVSCSGSKTEEPEPTPSLTIAPESLPVIESIGGSNDLTIVANNLWTAKSDAEWITLSRTSGDKGTTPVTVSVSKNSTAEGRTGEIVFQSGSLSKKMVVSQAGVTLTLTPESLPAAESTGSSYDLTVESSDDWEAKTEADWISLSQKSGSKGKSSVIVKIEKNSTAESRTASITFTSGNLTKTLEITQKAEDRLVVEKKSFEVASNSSRIEIPVETNTELKAETNEAWLNIVESRALRKGVIVVSVDENKDSKKRSGEIRITGGSLKEIVKVTQQGNMSTGGSIDDMPIEKL